MNPELCDLLENGGVVSCFLADENGIPLDPFDPSSNLCTEGILTQSRKDVDIVLPNGEIAALQNINIRKAGFIVVQVTNGIDTCVSEPIPFCKVENVLLCAPEGTDINCRITDFRCYAVVHCQNGFYQSVEIFLDICQEIQSVTETVIEITGNFCSPREQLIRNRCPLPIMPPQCGEEQDQVADQLEIITECVKDNDLVQQEIICVNTEKVYDWVGIQSKLEIRRSAEDAPFICDICTIDLFVSAAITCEGTISGTVECDGEPVEGATVVLTASSDIVTIVPNPVITDAFGSFEATVTVPEGTDPTEVIITASSVVNNQAISSTAETIVSCPEEPCTLELFAAGPIECNGFISGNITCGDTSIPDVPVTLTAVPDIIEFDPNPAITGEGGNFFSGITVPDETPSTPVEITATATVDGEVLSDTISVTVSCDQACVLVLESAAEITCEGEITGTLTCDGIPQEGVLINFSSFPDTGTFDPDPAITEADGTFTTTLTIPEGTPETAIFVTAQATVGDETVTDTIGIQVDCPGEECPCKFRIGIQGNRAEAEVDITANGVPSTLSGTINVTAIQCFTAAPMCNPAVDNFNVTFGDNGSTINFTQGRRIEIECIGNTFASVRGTANVSGNVLPEGVYEVTITLTIGPDDIGTWTVDATDTEGNTFTTTFEAEISPPTFIGECDETP
ncbi:BMQ_0737 family morphogenetic spore coat protein [Gracilibacillus oryzae]|uniref:Ig-like domain-containing protein n=1 Tax=Gracilibacillus oryzae TaxID=1672701 RepID=UPI001D1824BC|nr:Ig-like domain-containing protein [Gracilibacillus oryzae]